MADYNQSISYVLSLEGGYANNPADPGGETNYGITRRTADAWGYTGSMRDLDPQTAGQIYLDLFWDPWNLSEVSNQGVANAILSLHVNASWAAQVIQAALASLGWTGAQDGIWGPQTLAGVNSADPRALVQALSDYAAQKYRAIAAARPASLQFLNGWLNRAADLANQVVDQVGTMANDAGQVIAQNPESSALVLLALAAGAMYLGRRG